MVSWSAVAAIYHAGYERVIKLWTNDPMKKAVNATKRSVMAMCQRQACGFFAEVGKSRQFAWVAFIM